MINIQTLKEVFLQNNTIILGSFKTLHLGHQDLIERARKHRFVTLMRINSSEQIFTNLEISWLIKQHNWNINNIFNLNFEQIKEIAALEFIELLKLNNIKNVICGDDFCFGKNRQGNISLLKQHFNVEVVEMKNINNKKISTSHIIKELKNGNLNYFKQTHGFDYFIYGKVTHGDKIGRTIDFPTINIDVNNKVLPPFGVYVANVYVNNKNYIGANYIGKRPSLNKIITRFETNILDFNEEIYENLVFVSLLHNIRHEMKFNGLEELKKQIRKDVENVKLWRNNNR